MVRPIAIQSESYRGTLISSPNYWVMDLAWRELPPILTYVAKDREGRLQVQLRQECCREGHYQRPNSLVHRACAEDWPEDFYPIYNAQADPELRGLQPWLRRGLALFPESVWHKELAISDFIAHLVQLAPRDFTRQLMEEVFTSE